MNKQLIFNDEKKAGVTKFEKVNNDIKTCNSNFEKQSNKKYADSNLFYPVNFIGSGRMCEDWSI